MCFHLTMTLNILWFRKVENLNISEIANT